MQDNYWGFGTRTNYVRFMAEKGVYIADIAAALGVTVWELMQSVPELDLLQYDILLQAQGRASRYWSQDELRMLFRYYPMHGAAWNGWRAYLPDRKPGTIRAMASKLGIPTKRGCKGGS
jgi:hypothetical protein